MRIAYVHISQYNTYIYRCCGGVFSMFSDSVTGSIEGTLRGNIGRTLVSHNNNTNRTSGGNRSLGGRISSTLGYSTVKLGEYCIYTYTYLNTYTHTCMFI
jgi:hypothetical protein